MTRSIEERLEQIEWRMKRVEVKLHLEPLVELPPMPAPVKPAAPVSVPPIPVATLVTPPPLPRAVEVGTQPTPSPLYSGERAGERGEQRRVGELRDLQSSAANPSPPPSPRVTGEREQELQPLAREVLPYVSPKPKPPQKQTALEQTIGLKWAGWIGAVVLLIGAALGVKYAFDQHWFAALPVWIWPSIIATCGFALIGAGEYVYRKVNVIPAASLFGAGVATLFLVSYIGHSYYQLYSPTTAFVLMGFTTLIGSAVAMRGKLVSIAVLSLIGGNVAPLVMGDTGAPHSTFMAYLLMLQLIALTLAWWGKSARWWMLRGLSLATTALWASAIIASHRDGMMPLGFAVAYAALYHLEVIASVLRADRNPEKTQDLQHGGAIFVTLVIAGLTACILTVLSDATGWVRADWLIGLAAACAVAGYALNDARRRLTCTLAPAYAASAAALLMLAVPVALDGMGVEIGWGILAIAMGIVGRSVKSKLASAGAVSAWMLALLHLIVTLPAVDVFHEHPELPVWMTINGVAIVSTTFLAWGLAIVGHVLAGLVRREDENSKFASATMAFVASLVFVVTSIVSLPPLGATLSLIAFAWVTLGADMIIPRANLAMHSIAVLLAATVKWVAVDTLGQRLSPGWSAAQYAPVINPLMGIGLLLAGSLVGVYWLRRDAIRQSMPDGRHAPLAATVALATVALLAIAFSFEIDRVVERAVLAQHALGWPAWQLKQMAWTMLWSASAVTLAFVLSRIDALGEKRAEWIGAVASFAVLMVGKFVVLDTLIYRLSEGPATAMVLFNLQTVTAATVFGALVAIRAMLRFAKPQAAKAGHLAMLAQFVVAWTGTFEVERFVILHPGLVAPWPMYQFKQMAWTMWWTICAAGGFVLARRYDQHVSRLLPGVVMMLAVKFMVADAMFWRITSHAIPAPIVANLQMLTAAVVIGALILLMALGVPGESDASRPLRVKAGFMALILALLSISLEIDRYFESSSAQALLADPHLAKQVAFSIVWSVFAVMSVAAGFKLRLASLRYFGLALLAFTLLKVVTVDLGQVSTGYRILSFLGLGLLMLGTSVLYGKLSPKLLKV